MITFAVSGHRRRLRTAVHGAALRSQFLSAEQTDAVALMPLLAPYAGELRIYPVSRAVNNPRNDDPRCLEPAA